ncbi:hypothetical protein Droror1_Dr00016836 [Drosera rotundifolia]
MKSNHQPLTRSDATMLSICLYGAAASYKCIGANSPGTAAPTLSPVTRSEWQCNASHASSDMNRNQGEEETTASPQPRRLSLGVLRRAVASHSDPPSASVLSAVEGHEEVEAVAEIETNVVAEKPVEDADEDLDDIDDEF